MKDFVVYTAARFVVFGVAFTLLWVVAGFFFERNQILGIAVLFFALVISSIISIFALAPLRDKLAYRIQNRAEQLHERIEESRRAEDVD